VLIWKDYAAFTEGIPAVLEIDRETGRVHGARQCSSPNQDARPSAADPDLVVIHAISLPPGQFGGDQVERLFTNTLDWGAHPYFEQIRGIEVSAHLLVRRDGELVQFVPLNRRAWHAGESRFRDRGRCNDFSVGIELEGDDDTPYDERQYLTLAAVIRELLEVYPAMSTRSIAAHSDIAPGRKTDPGPAFDWLRLYDSLA